jgi:hypothetical protein
MTHMSHGKPLEQQEGWATKDGCFCDPRKDVVLDYLRENHDRTRPIVCDLIYVNGWEIRQLDLTPGGVEIGVFGMTYFNHLIEKETECHKCIHNKVCAHDYQKRCVNHWWGRSDGPSGCHQCTHRFHRKAWCAEGQPCFHCREFSPV